MNVKNLEIAKLCLIFSCVVCCVASSGCSKKRVFVPASGTATLDGVAVEGATVSLVPQVAEGGSSATGITDASGKFSLAFGGENGVAPGEYFVSVAKISATVIENKENPLLNTVKFGKNELPEKYSDAKTSGLTASVKKGMEPLDLSLTE